MLIWIPETFIEKKNNLNTIISRKTYYHNLFFNKIMIERSIHILVHKHIEKLYYKTRYEVHTYPIN